MIAYETAVKIYDVTDSLADALDVLGEMRLEGWRPQYKEYLDDVEMFLKKFWECGHKVPIFKGPAVRA